MSTISVAGLQLPDSSELRALATDLADAGDEIGHHTGRISNVVFAAPGEVVANAVPAAHAFARRWDTVGGALTKVSRAGDTAANALRAFAGTTEAAESAWRSAVRSAAAQQFTLTAVGREAELASPAMPAGATPADTSAQQTLAGRLKQAGQSAIDDYVTGRSRVLADLRGIALPDLDDLSGQAPRALPTTGDGELDAEIALLAHPILSIPRHFSAA